MIKRINSRVRLKRVLSVLRLIRKSSCTTVHYGFLICASLEIPPFESPFCTKLQKKRKRPIIFPAFLGKLFQDGTKYRSEPCHTMRPIERYGLIIPRTRPRIKTDTTPRTATHNCPGIFLSAKIYGQYAKAWHMPNQIIFYICFLNGKARFIFFQTENREKLLERIPGIPDICARGLPFLSGMACHALPLQSL